MGVFGYEALDDKKMEEKIHAFRNKMLRERLPGQMQDYVEQMKLVENKTDGFAQNLIQHERRQTMAVPRDLSEKMAGAMMKKTAAAVKMAPMPCQDL